VEVVAVIPARLGSTRLPGKALAEIGGEPMVVRVWRRARLVPGVARVLVATDDERIRAVVAAAGGEAVLTDAGHPSGTDRVAEAVRGTTADLVVNIQGDEPFLDPAAVGRLVKALEEAPAEEAGTIATPLAGAGELYDPAAVKVVVGRDGHALYFSRSPVPWREDLWDGPATRPPRRLPDPGGYLRHVGVYAYRPGFLERLTGLAPTPAETVERLEQLRILEHGHRILVVVAPWDGISVDTAEDLARARERAAREVTGAAGA